MLAVVALSVGVVFMVLLVANVALSACTAFQAGKQEVAGGRGVGPPIHVCFSSDDSNLEPLVVAIRSIAASCSEPERLQFHFITSPEVAGQAQATLPFQLGGTKLRIHQSQGILARLSSSIGADHPLGGPYSYARFFFADILQLSAQDEGARLVALDLDIVIQGDIVSLATMDLRGKAVGAIRDCSSNYEELMDFSALSKNGLSSTFDPHECIVRWGVLVIDIARWRQLQIAERIETWASRGRQCMPPAQSPEASGQASSASKTTCQPIFKQPGPLGPMLLSVAVAVEGENAAAAAAAGFANIRPEWLCDGLSRNMMVLSEALVLQKKGLEGVLSELNVNQDEEGNIYPFVTMCTLKAKALHFNGPSKPWLVVHGNAQHRPSLCAFPAASGLSSWKGTPSFSLEDDRVIFVACKDIWNRYMSVSTLQGMEEEEDAPAGTDQTQKGLDSKWVDLQEQFLGNLRNKVANEKEKQKEREKAAEKAKKARKEKEKEKEREKEKAEAQVKIAGGFSVAQKVRSISDIAVKGQIVVRRGMEGTVQGPSIRHPQERVTVYFVGRTDGKFRSVNVMPREIEAVDEGE